VILPVVLTLLGAAVDTARVYGAWNVLQSATRDAAEYAATNDTTSGAAAADASRIVCAEVAGLPPGCSRPTVTVSSYSLSTSAPGASTNNPIATVTVSTSLPFNTLFPYPLFTQSGIWTLRSTQTFAVVQGR